MDPYRSLESLRLDVPAYAKPGTVYTSYGAGTINLASAKANWFTLISLTLFLVAAAGPVAKYGFGYDPFEGAGIPLPLPLVSLAAGVLFYAYMVGATARSSGLGFWWAFLLSFFPPAAPAVWARIAGTGWLRAYGILAGVLAANVFTGLLSHNQPLAVEVAAVFTLPFGIAACFGGSAPSLGRALGINAVLITVVLCVVPAALLGVTVWELDDALTPDSAGGQLSLPGLILSTGITDVKSMPSEALYFGCLWIVMSVGLWIKTVYENLRYQIDP